MIPFETRLFSFYVKQHQEKLEFTAMGTILLIVFKFSTSPTTNHFSVFPKELKGRFLAILHVHRFRLSGISSLLYIHENPFSSSCIYSCIYPHNFSLSFCYPSWYKYNKNLL